VNFI